MSDPRVMIAEELLHANDPSWRRPDGAMKGQGYFGPLPAGDGRTSTELSIGVNMGGKEQDIPSLVPTLSPAEVNHMLMGNAPTEAISRKAVAHAMTRQQAGKPIYAGPEEKPVQWGVPWRRQ